MNWQALEKVDIQNKEIYVQAFAKLIKEIKEEIFDFKDKEADNYFIINKNNIVYVVPKEIINLFNQMVEESPNEFLGFTVLVKDNIRASCFGVPCTECSRVVIGR